MRDFYQLLDEYNAAPDADLAELEARLREGPSFSSVAGVERVAIEAPGHRGFEIR